MRGAFGTDTFVAVVRTAGGASDTGSGRLCITARRRGCVSGTAGRGPRFKNGGGGSSATGFIESPVVRGVSSGGADRRVRRLSTASGGMPAAGSPAPWRASAKNPPPARISPAA